MWFFSEWWSTNTLKQKGKDTEPEMPQLLPKSVYKSKGNSTSLTLTKEFYNDNNNMVCWTAHSSWRTISWIIAKSWTFAFWTVNFDSFLSIISLLKQKGLGDSQQHASGRDLVLLRNKWFKDFEEIL